MVKKTRKPKPKPRKAAEKRQRTKADTETKPADAKPKKTSSKLLKAALAGDERGILEQALIRLTEEAETCDASRLPGLIRELRQVSREIKLLPKEGKNAVDEIAKARDRRRATAARR